MRVQVMCAHWGVKKNEVDWRDFNNERMTPGMFVTALGAKKLQSFVTHNKKAIASTPISPPMKIPAVAKALCQRNVDK